MRSIIGKTRARAPVANNALDHERAGLAPVLDVKYEPLLAADCEGLTGPAGRKSANARHASGRSAAIDGRGPVNV